ncbi:uncharacterized protein SETTUDRAFT_167502 [Exserohilum turcica Et28A]|uniref:Uncharacterized protein n=1 Tax=Exserohilum turcicum (strain 28A) TaxID=671987 RepID=R0KPA7_EXST2|nr:uncharacterized protein SETTUDRAFT_167502 [Exserohilum turcica Et28A]EOA89677.1 hypothetical protein SETTUDRAFT_167502 [Exserohilum turcica Et28A]
MANRNGRTPIITTAPHIYTHPSTPSAVGSEKQSDSSWHRQESARPRCAITPFPPVHMHMDMHPRPTPCALAHGPVQTHSPGWHPHT